MLPQLRVTPAVRSELRRLGESPFLSQQGSLLPIKPSVIAVAGLAGFGLGSHFVSKKNVVLKNSLIGAAILSGLAGAWFFLSGE